MNALTVLGYGQQTVLEAVHGLRAEDWTSPNVCGVWSVKDIVAHLASFEQVLVEVLKTFEGEPQGPLLEQFCTRAGFNDEQVAARKPGAVTEVLGEYERAHNEVMALAAALPKAMFWQIGTLPWYGAKYSLDDLIVYAYYGHKREHAAQIKHHKRTAQAVVAAV